MSQGRTDGWETTQLSASRDPCPRVGAPALRVCCVSTLRITRGEVGVSRNMLSLVVAVLVIILLIYLILQFV